MSQRSTFQVRGIDQVEKQRAEIQSLKDTPGITGIVINIQSRTVTLEHDPDVTVAMIEKALKDLRLNPSLTSTAGGIFDERVTAVEGFLLGG
ncbi:hypothetical protein SUGI_0141720 [Cryptomeria japonica]|nr:hypothetical protein SUGI_0141720 [Cryptomeria japonica]